LTLLIIIPILLEKQPGNAEKITKYSFSSSPFTYEKENDNLEIRCICKKKVFYDGVTAVIMFIFN